MKTLAQTKKIDPIINCIILSSIILGLFIITAILTSITASLLPIYFLVLLIVGFFIFKYPETGLYLILIQTMIFERTFTLQPFFINNQLIKIYPLDFIILITALSALNKFRPKNIFQKFIIDLKKNSISKMLIIWNILVTLYFLASVLFIQSASPALAFGAWKNYCFYTIIYFLFIHSVNKPEQIKRFLKIFLNLSVLLLVFLVIGFINNQGLWVEINFLSTIGVRYLANSHALYLMPAIFLITSFLAFGKKIFSRYTLPILFIQTFAVVISLFRHLWLGLVFGFLIIFFGSNKDAKKNLAKIITKFLILIIIFIIIFCLMSNLLPFDAPGSSLLKGLSLRWQNLIHYKKYFDTSAMWRLAVWEKSLEIIKANPIFGLGFGRLITIHFLDYEKQIPIRDVHNEWLGLVIQMGAIGLFSILFFIIHLVHKIIKFKKQAAPVAKPAILGTGAFLLSFLFMANFNVYFSANLFLIFFLLFLGLLINLHENSSNKQIQ